VKEIIQWGEVRLRRISFAILWYSMSVAFVSLNFCIFSSISMCFSMILSFSRS
jgi:hypothetical protein